MIALLQHLVVNEYFSNVNQTFMTTGHSFLPSDRDFAMIEKAKKGKKYTSPFILLKSSQTPRIPPDRVKSM